MARGEREVEIDGRRLRVTNLEKPLYPSGFTKGEVLDYYLRVAPALLPHLKGRALTLRRFPNGVEGQSFFEKRCPSHAPDWIHRETVPVGDPREDETIDFCVCEERATLAWLAQLASLELHPYLAFAKRPDHPTVLAVDLDPGPPADAVQCAQVALELRSVLGELGLEGVAKSSGSKGLQLYVPLNTKVDFAATKAFAKALAQVMETQLPKLVVSKMSKELRKGKVFIDWSQNDRAKTTIGVYSLRAKDRPTASTPLTWEEVEAVAEDGDPAAVAFEAGEVLERVEDHGDLFAEVLTKRQRLPEL